MIKHIGKLTGLSILANFVLLSVLVCIRSVGEHTSTKSSGDRISKSSLPTLGITDLVANDAGPNNETLHSKPSLNQEALPGWVQVSKSLLEDMSLVLTDHYVIGPSLAEPLSVTAAEMKAIAEALDDSYQSLLEQEFHNCEVIQFEDGTIECTLPAAKRATENYVSVVKDTAMDILGPDRGNLVASLAEMDKKNLTSMFQRKLELSPTPAGLNVRIATFNEDGLELSSSSSAVKLADGTYNPTIMRYMKIIEHISSLAKK